MRRRQDGAVPAVRLWLAVVAFVLGSLVAMPPAGAQYVNGVTWFADGSFYKEVPTGSVVSLFATGARPNRLFRLFALDADAPGDYPCPAIGGVQIHPALRGSSSRGLIPSTTTVLTLPRGRYLICFREEPSQPGSLPPSGTFHVVLRVL